MPTEEEQSNAEKVESKLSAEDIQAFIAENFNGYEAKKIRKMSYGQIGKEKMPENCRLVINIPAFHLEKNLYNTLVQYLRQDAEKKGIEFEVIVCINGPTGTKLNESTAFKDAARFHEQHPEFNLLICTTQYTKDEAKMGRIRRDMAAFTLNRAAAGSNIDLENLIIVTNDADLVKLDKEYVSGYVESFENNPKMGAIAGIYDYPMEDYYSNHLFLAVQRFNDILDIMSLYKCDNIVFKGGNSAFRTKHYIEAGGIDSKRQMSELRTIYKNIRNSDPESVSFNRKKARIQTSARRQIMALGHNVPISSCHDTFGQDDDLAEHYHKPADELKIPEITSKVTANDFSENLENELRGLHKKMAYMMKKDYTPEEIQKVFIRAGFYTGIKVSFNENGELVVDDITKLKEQILKKYDHN